MSARSRLAGELCGLYLNLRRWRFKSVAIGSILILAMINIRGVRLGGGLLRGITVLKLGLLTFLLLWGFGFQLGSWSTSRRSLPARALRAASTGFGRRDGAAFFSFGGGGT